jgi:CRISPR-associated endonuclease/helicase Cas3
MTSPVFWAKPDQTYEEHIQAAYNAWKSTVSSKSNLIQRVGKLYGFNEERFLKSSLLTVVLHDIGKNIKPFQQMMLAKQAGKSFDYRENYRHELESFSFTFRGAMALSSQEGGPLLGKVPLEALAVLGHHKRIDPSLDSFHREGVSAKPPICKEGMCRALSFAGQIFENEGYNFPEIQIHEYDPYREVSKLIGYGGVFTKVSGGESNPDAVRATYSLLKAILHYSDWLGSAGKELPYSVKLDSNGLLKEIEQRCVEKQIAFSRLRPFQQECANIKEHVIAVAPTGSGKTEAALFWALNNIRDMQDAKLIYLLPTMVTANSIFLRLEDYFGKGNVGLSHSTATFMRDNEEENPSERTVLFDKSFIKPATVATVDQLLAAGFNTGKWTLIEANAANSVVIIDEIHSYDRWTLGLIIESLKHFSKLGTRFMLMSATLPHYLIELFSKSLPNVKIIRDETLLSSCRNRYQTFEKSIDDAIPEIEHSVMSGKKTLVVVNNVAKCQELYKKLGYLNPLCYHSKFTIDDRRSKEERIDEAKLLIATQVIEVSLDIDYDIMFTECAPPDALVQRAGRVNRRRVKKDSRIYIFQASKTSEKIYDPDSTGLLARSFEIFKNSRQDLTESDLISIVENVYAGIDIEHSENFIDAIRQYVDIQNTLMGIFDNPNKFEDKIKTRKEEYLQIPVIPLIFKHQITASDFPPSKRRLFEVKMPYWYVRKHKEVYDDIMFCEMKYDSDIGASFADDSKVSNLII